jgi:putative inorganic carbon (HCO3(-)) transporter
MGRINAWHVAYNVAKDRITGGGFSMFQTPTFRQYASNPSDVHDAHSIYFQILGEHGFIGLVLFLLLGFMIWRKASKVVRITKNRSSLKWAGDLAAMVQVSMIGYATGGAFLGLAYFDLPYNFLAIVLIAYHIALKEVNPLPLASDSDTGPKILPNLPHPSGVK